MNNELVCLGTSNGNILVIDLSKSEPTPLISFGDHADSVLALYYDREL
jgi:hypothetical protein